jgi:hypothetical protein
MVRRLLEHGIDDQGFSQTALELGSIRAADYVGEAERWVDYYQQLEYELIEGGHFEFLSATRNAKDDLRSRIHNARITIFLCAAPTSAKPLSRQSGVRV